MKSKNIYTVTFRDHPTAEIETANVQAYSESHAKLVLQFRDKGINHNQIEIIEIKQIN